MKNQSVISPDEKPKETSLSVAELSNFKEILLKRRKEKKMAKFTKDFDQITIDLNTFAKIVNELREMDIDKNFANLQHEKNMIAGTKMREHECVQTLSVMQNLLHLAMTPTPNEIKAGIIIGIHF